jgi:hypothetical protein
MSVTSSWHSHSDNSKEIKKGTRGKTSFLLF